MCIRDSRPHFAAGEVDRVAGAIDHAFARVVLAGAEDRVVATRAAAGLDEAGEGEAALHGLRGNRAEDFGRIRPPAQGIALDAVSYTHLDVYKRQLNEMRERLDKLSRSR